MSLCHEATNQTTSTPVRTVQSPVTSSIQQVLATSDVEHHSTDNNNDNNRHHSNIENDADAHILRLPSSYLRS